MDRDVAEAQWRRLSCNCALLRDQLADAVSGERFEDAEGLEAELGVDAAEVERLQQHWGFQGDVGQDLQEESTSIALEQERDGIGGCPGEVEKGLAEGEEVEEVGVPADGADEEHEAVGSRSGSSELHGEGERVDSGSEGNEQAECYGPA